MTSIIPQSTTSVTSYPLAIKRYRLAIVLLATVLVSIVVPASRCQAGGGPENVFLLVNSTSQDSMRIANHYISLRKIPATNVFYIPYKGSKVVTSGEVLREQFLKPALAEIKRRKLTGQIDYMVYSADFPYQIGLTADFPDQKFSQLLPPRGALTGFTYLQKFVLEKRKEVVNLNSNWYYMEPLSGISVSRAFRSSYRWALGGRRTGAQGIPYMISAILGVTGGKGNTVEEILHCLQTAREGDGTKPPGPVYFMKHDGPRSKPRHDLFAAAATELRRMGIAAQVLDGKFPTNKGSIAGLACGTAYTDVKRSGIRFLPGAYCDNFTSYGALFSLPKNPIDPKTGKKRKIHVCVSEFIRLGAAAANGTVFEPYSIRQKFPIPSVHVHYANGCSLGEAFYQSVSGPYQQLLVGDPLCQPWATIPKVQVEGITDQPFLRGEVEITPSVEDEKAIQIKAFELFVDGVRTQRCRPGDKFKLDTTGLTDGVHELRVVATVDNPIETQGRLIADVKIKNGRDAIALSTSQKRLSVKDEYLTLNVISTSNQPAEIYFNSEQLAELPTGSGQAKVEIAKLGAGPVEIFATSEKLRSQPLRLNIAP